MNEDDLLFLLERSRHKNAELGITGMLLYMESVFMGVHEGRFIQLLEGHETAVMSLYASIQADPRHHEVLLLRKGPAEQRYFQNWTMGFKALDEHSYPAIPGFFELDDELLKSGPDHSFAAPLNLLRSFYELNQE